MADINNPWALMGLQDPNGVPQDMPAIPLAMNGAMPTAPTAQQLRQMAVVPDSQAPAQAAPPPTRSAMAPRPMQAKSQDEMNYAEAFKQLMAQRASDAAGLQKQLDAEKAKDFSGIQYADFSPLVNLVDGLTGSKMAQNYTPPTEKATSAAMVQKLQDALAKTRDQQSDDNFKYAKALGDERARMDANDARREYQQTLAAIAAGKKDQGDRRSDLREAGLSSAAANSIHNDPALKMMRQNAGNLDNGLALLNDPNSPPSVTTMNEIAQDFAAALGNKGVASDHKLKEISTPTLQGNMAKLQGFLSSDPNQPAPPEVVAFWRDMGNRLQGAYDRQMALRAAGKLQGLKTAYGAVPRAYQAAQEAAESYANGGWRAVEFPQMPGGGVPAHYQAPAPGGQTTAAAPAGGLMDFETWKKSQGKQSSNP